MSPNNPQFDITVVIPSYNRAHLLHKTIPSYIQEGVKEIIIVDDHSSDNTKDVVEQLRETYHIITYLRLPQNLKQTAAKNKGLECVTTKWVYFGDDDSILNQNSLSFLSETAIKNEADIVGARALYMHPGEDQIPLEQAIANYDGLIAHNVSDLIQLESLKFQFNRKIEKPVQVPLCQACILMKTDLAKKVMFDTNYIGNAYREETDFIVRCTKEGAKVYYDSRAIQINLPPKLATGGSRGKSLLKYKMYCIRNNWYFLKRNWSFLKSKYNIPRTVVNMQIRFMSGYIIRPIKRFLGL